MKRNNKSRNKLQKKLIFLLVASIVICIIGIQSLPNKKDDNSSISNTDTLVQNLNNKEDLVEKEGEVLNVEPVIKEVENPTIPGFEEIEGTSYPMTVFNGDITIRSIGSYSGPYVEDGSNDNIENVLGVILHNNSDKMMEACLLNLTATDGTSISFMAASIPANADIFILAQNRYVIKENDRFEYSDCVAAFIENWHTYNDLVEVKCINQAFELTNLSEQNLSKVYVCYKNKVNDIYFGGITYRVSFDNVEAKQTYTKNGNHFNTLSEVVYVSGEK